MLPFSSVSHPTCAPCTQIAIVVPGSRLGRRGMTDGKAPDATPANAGALPRQGRPRRTITHQAVRNRLTEVCGYNPGAHSRLAASRIRPSCCIQYPHCILEVKQFHLLRGARRHGRAALPAPPARLGECGSAWHVVRASGPASSRCTSSIHLGTEPFLPTAQTRAAGPEWRRAGCSDADAAGPGPRSLPAGGRFRP